VTGILSTDYFDLPLVLRIGISNEFKLGLKNNLILSLDAVSPNDNANYINLGGKINILDDLVSIYGGVNSLFLDNAESEYCFGFGMKLPSFMNNTLSINYTYEEMKFLGDSQQMSISINY
jgi:hypothetical protein